MQVTRLVSLSPARVELQLEGTAWTPTASMYRAVFVDRDAATPVSPMRSACRRSLDRSAVSS